jgi:hypothetical protein
MKRQSIMPKWYHLQLPYGYFPLDGRVEILAKYFLPPVT